MSTRWNFKNNYNKYTKEVKPLDTNVEHYKKQVGGVKPYQPKADMNGVAIFLSDGTRFVTDEYTVDEVRRDYIEQNKHYLWLRNGGCVNLAYMTRLMPYNINHR